MFSNWEKPCYASAEAGENEFYGGIAFVAIYLKEDALKKLKEEKRFYSQLIHATPLCDRWIIENAPKIIKLFEKNYEILIISSEEYNELYSKHKNIGNILSLLHNDVHLKLKNKIKEKAFKVEDTSKQTRKQYLSSYLAWIMARYYFLKQIKEMTLKYDFKVPLNDDPDWKDSSIIAFKKLSGKDEIKAFCKTNLEILQKIKSIIEGVRTGQACLKCKRELVFRYFQETKKQYICCDNYPKCKYIQCIDAKKHKIKETCPICTRALTKWHYDEKNFIITCSHYPRCSYLENLPFDREKCCYASDESGTGDFFGGPVVAAVYLNKEVLEQLSKKHYWLQIKDSKKCTNSWIIKYAPKIINILNKNYEFLIIIPKKYNELYSKHKNIGNILSLLHNDVHLKLKNKIKEKAFRVMDKWTNLDKHYEYLKKVNIQALRVDDMCEKAEEKYLACALASIIARYYYLKQIDEMSAKYGVKIPLGSYFDKEQTLVTAFKNLIKKASIEEICKMNCKTLEKLKKIISEEIF